MPIAIYARVSSEEQADAGTIANQLDYARRFVDLNSLKVYSEYLDEGISGTVPLADRPAGRKLLADAKARRFDAVLVYRVDRLARKIRVLLDAQEALTAAGVDLRSMTEPIDTSSPIGRFVFQLLGSISELERETILERTQLGNTRAAREGRWLGGRPPYAYRVADKRLVLADAPIPGQPFSEIDIVRTLYERLAAGATCFDLAAWLNGLGIPPVYKRDNRQVEGQPTVGVWSPARLRNLLVETTYYGIHTYGKEAAQPRELIEREVPAIVSRDLWERAIAQLHRNHYLRPNLPTRRVYLLRGLVRCAACGQRYHGTSGGGNKLAYYYRCNGRIPYRAIAGEHCRAPSVRTEVLEGYVWDEIVRFVTHPGAALHRLTERYRERVAVKTTVSTNAESVQTAIDAKARERDVVVRLLRSEVITYDEGAKHLAELDREVKALQQERDRLFAAVAESVDAEKAIIDAGMLLDSLREKVLVADAETKARVIKQLVREVVISGQSRKPEITVVFAFGE